VSDAAPTAPELAKMLRETRDKLGPAFDDAPCHYGITTRDQCCRCSVIDAAGQMLDRVAETHPEWLR
jgi:hypothetical protein